MSTHVSFTLCRFHTHCTKLQNMTSCHPRIATKLNDNSWNQTFHCYPGPPGLLCLPILKSTNAILHRIIEAAAFFHITQLCRLFKTQVLRVGELGSSYKNWGKTRKVITATGPFFFKASRLAFCSLSPTSCWSFFDPSVFPSQSPETPILLSLHLG